MESHPNTFPRGLFGVLKMIAFVLELNADSNSLGSSFQPFEDCQSLSDLFKKKKITFNDKEYLKWLYYKEHEHNYDVYTVHNLCIRKWTVRIMLSTYPFYRNAKCFLTGLNGTPTGIPPTSLIIFS